MLYVCVFVVVGEPEQRACACVVCVCVCVVVALNSNACLKSHLFAARSVVVGFGDFVVFVSLHERAFCGHDASRMPLPLLRTER